MHNQFRAERAWDFSPEIGVLVIAGGENSSSYLDRVEMSDNLGDSFTELAPLPKSLKNGCLVIAGRTIFHAGGRTSKVNDVLKDIKIGNKHIFSCIFPSFQLEHCS